MKRSRRRFLGLLAAGSAAAAATPVASLARAAATKPKPAKPVPGTPGAKPAVAPAVAEEIRKQKAAVDQALRAVRDCPLPPGSEPGFVFAPLGPRKPDGRP